MSLDHSVWLRPMHGFDHFEERPQTQSLVTGQYLAMHAMCDFID